MHVAVKTLDGTTVSYWTDVAEVQLVPGPIPVIMFLADNPISGKKVSGIQALQPGMYAQYINSNVLEH